MSSNAQYQNKGMTGSKSEANGGCKPSENGDTNFRGGRGVGVGGFRGGSNRGAAPKSDTDSAPKGNNTRGANIGLMGQQQESDATGRKSSEINSLLSNLDLGGGGGRGGEGSRGRGRGPGAGAGAANARGQYDEGGRGGGRGGGGRWGRGGMGEKDRITEKLRQLGGPLLDLPPREEEERKFSNHCRLWIGNLPLDIGEDDVKDLFKPYGDFDEVYFDKTKGFAFVRMDYKVNAEKARLELNMKEYHGRQLKIRFSSPGTALKVRNFSPWVTNELLELSFGVFGELEKAMVCTDERGRSTGEGIVEFCKKPHAMLALRKCQEGCFILNSSPRPVIVEQMAVVDENEGLSEVNINKRNPEYLKERQEGPRFANNGTFEFEYGMKWKQLYELFDKKKEALENELQDEKKKLEEQMELAKYEHETEMLRDQLRQRELMNERNKTDFEARQREWDDHRRVEDERVRREDEELTLKYRQQEEELRRRQEENRVFMQERSETMKSENCQDDYLSGGYQTTDGRWVQQQSQRRSDGYSHGSSSWRGGGSSGGENWGRSLSSAQGHSPGQYDGAWDHERNSQWHSQDQYYSSSERMGYNRGPSSGTAGTVNSLPGGANDDELSSSMQYMRRGYTYRRGYRTGVAS